MLNSSGPEGQSNATDTWVAAAMPVVDELRDVPAVKGVVVCGSIPAGLGTSRSDIDLVVLSVDGSSIDVKNTKNVEMRVDFEFHSLEDAHAAVRRITTFDECTDHLYWIAAEYKFVGQLVCGAVAVLDNGAINGLLREAQAARSRLGELGLRRNAIWATNTLEDVLGFLDDRDLFSAIRRSLHLLELGLDSWCIARGDVYPDEKFKWIWRRLEKVGLTSSQRDTLLQLYLTESVTTGDLWRLVRRRIALAQTLLCRAYLMTWGPQGATEESERGMFEGSSTTGQPTLGRSIDWTMQHHDGSWVLSNGTQSYSVPITAAAAWTYADGRPAEDVRRLVRVARGTAHEALSLATADSVVDRLLEVGILTRTFDRGGSGLRSDDPVPTGTGGR